jgi:hypothetical protein
MAIRGITAVAGPGIIAALAACSTVGLQTATDRSRPMPRASTLSAGCESFAGIPIPGTVLSVSTVAAGTVLSANVLPEHCVFTGRMNQRVGADGKPYHIGFELRVPKQWNGRLAFQGGGGNDGAIRAALGSLAGNEASLPALQTGALVQGYAVVTTDAGHQGADASFGLDPQARIDHAYNAYDKVTVAAKALIARVHGRPPDRSYFVGCSGGGRQALLFPQRFADYFDGIAATAPAMKVAKEASVAAVWNVLSFLAVAPTDAAGGRILSRAFSASDMDLLSGAIRDRCDALDGTADGIISVKPSACSFDAAVLQCRGAKQEGCLSAEQVAALKKDFGGPRDSAGRQLYASWPWDTGVAGADWRRWRLGTSTTSAPNSRNATLIAADAMRYEFFTPADPAFDYLSFNFDKDPARMDAYASIYNTTSTDVTAFKNRGGKMLLIHGVSDPIFSANDTVDYYQRLSAANNGTEETRKFARLYLVPGMNHCSASGGPSTDLYDALTPLRQWVEEGIAPDRIIAKAGPAAPWPGRTRPLCPFPQEARYNGSGSIEDAASFTCR